MRGSKYPDGVTVDQVALRRTELTKAQEILRNRIDWTCRGVFSGGVVTVNLIDDTRIDIMQASGFAPNGEYIETSSPYYSIALADYTLGTVNYVCLVYTEADSYRQPHESDGQRYYTRAEMAWRVRVYTAAQYALLPSSDENLANDAQDRIIFFAKVIANGVGISLTSSSIVGPRSFNNIMYTVPRKCVTILGVDILSASAGSPLGAGTLTYVFTPGTPPTYQFTWSTSNGAGAPVLVAADGDYTLLDGAGEFITIRVALAVLPIFTVATTLTETITVFNLYYQEMPRLSAEDHLHRNYIGTGTVTPQNPHGNSLDDFSGETLSMLDEHQDVLHCNGIWRGSASSIFQITVLNNPGIDTFNLVAPAGGDLYYVNGIKLDSIDFSVGVTIPPPAVQSTYFYEIYVSDEATLEFQQKAAYPTLAPRTVTGTWIVDMSPNYPAGSATLACTTLGGPNPRTFTWDGGKPVSLTPLVDPPQAIRLYAADGEHWIDLWVNTTPGVNPDEILPVANVFDAITIFSSLTDGSNQFMQIAGLLYWYDAVGVKWVLGYDPLVANKYAVDKRIWGNTGTENMSTWALEDLAYLPNNELGRSGALLRRNGVYNEFQYTYGGAGFNFSVNGGSFYCRGQRLSVKSTQSLIAIPSAAQLVWADMFGVYHTLNVTGTFGGDLQAAMRYVLGSTQNIPSVSAVYHYSDTTDAPERGILLYYLVTDATDITSIVDFTQNVNRVDDPWSAASRISSTAVVHSQAAYDNLFTAFEYAKYSMYTGTGTENRGAVTITVTGIVEVGTDSLGNPLKVIQPEYVNVRGTRGLNAPFKSLVRVVGTDTWGTWQLSVGCKVSNLSVYNTSATLAAITLDHYTTVEECFFVSLGGAFFRSADSGEVSSLGVVLRGNTSTGAPLLNAAYLPNGHVGWVIQGNEILAVPAGTVGGIELPNVEKLTLTGNIISLPDSNDSVVTSSGGINIISNGFQCQDVVIHNNHISVGNNAPGQVNSVAGMRLKEIWFADVSGNIITRASGSATQIGVGLYLESLSQSSVVNNKISLMGGGIFVRGYLYDTEVSRNKMSALFHSGIDVEIDSFPVLNSAYGLRIEDNDIYNMAKGSLGGVFLSAELTGIYVGVDLVPANSILNGVSISRNIVTSMSSAGNIQGILFYTNVGTGGCKSFKFDDNIVTFLISTAGIVRGVYVTASFSGANSSLYDVSASRNNVSNLGSPGNIYGIHFYLDVSTGACKSFKLDDNQMTTLLSTAGAVHGVCVEGAGAGSIPALFSLCGNMVYFTSVTASPLVYGIAVLTDINDSVIDSNTIVIEGSDTAEGIALHAIGRRLTISNNILSGRKVGAYVEVFSGVVISSNSIDSNGVGLYLDHPYADTLAVGNTIRVYAYNENPYTAGSGTHCIGVGPGNGVNLKDNVLYLNGVVSGGDPADVPEGSACIRLWDSVAVSIDGCKMYSSVSTVVGGDGSVTRAYLLAYRAVADAAGAQSVLSVKGCMFDDRYEDEGTTRTPLHSLYLVPSAGFDHANGDSLSASITGNTFFTSSAVGAPAIEFNEEGRGLLGGVYPGVQAPYVIYVPPTFGDPVGDVATQVFFVANSIHGYPTQDISVPYVYIAKFDTSFVGAGGNLGVCFYGDSILTNLVSCSGVGAGDVLRSWIG